MRARERLRDRKKEQTGKGIPAMKSVRRNAEFTSFTSYTSAIAHIINITEKGYSSSLRQHMEKRRGMQRGGGEDRKKARSGTACDIRGWHRWGMWSTSSSLK